MRLGIDFGTTRVVVAFVDRGNYPVVVFDSPDGTAREWFPPLVAVQGDRRVYGWEAWAKQEEARWTIVRSLKRALEASGPETRVQVGGQVVPMLQLLREMVETLRLHLVEHSNLPVGKLEPLEVMLGVPANANSNQRFLTAQAFQEGGFHVLGLLNEPSAASIEFGHRDRASRQTKEEKTRILVYDLGGGTFDASLVELDGRMHSVIASEGISTLGGDDFDGLLADLALDEAGVGAAERGSLSQAELFRLHEECRQKKESLHPNTRHIVIDLGLLREGWKPCSLHAADFYERCRPLVEETLHATEDLLAQNGYGALVPVTRDAAPAGSEVPPRLEALYVTGGGSELPLISRMLREVFGRRVRRSTYTRSATAIGLAIQSDAQAGYRLREKFTRYFGVWREGEGGRTVVFDPLFPKGALLPEPGAPPLVSHRRYYPAHNLGHFRYLECGHLADDGRPAGDLTLWDDIRFPFDPTLRRGEAVKNAPVVNVGPGSLHEVEESYSCDSSGAVIVTISSLGDNYSRQYRLGRWAASDTLIVPGRKKRTSKK
jgi:molecular chaperone DnaK (HSP70)